MPAIHKGSPNIRFEFVASKRQSVLGGLPAIEALAQQFDLWRKLRQLSLIDPRKRKGSGFGPDAIVAQFIGTFKVLPPRQRPASFSVDQIMETLQEPRGG